MSPEKWEQIKEAFGLALETDPEGRARLISDVCKDDPELVAEVTKLLREHEELGDFLSDPVSRLVGSLLPGAVIADRYEIEQLLGTGGMGEVYRARDTLLKECVALKILRGPLGMTSSLGGLHREIQAARKVTHPNVCRVFDLGVHTFPEPGRLPLHFLSMELLEGETLKARIERDGRLHGAQALAIAIQIAEGLAAAHKAGIIHRDLKPGNIVLIPNASGDRAVVTDFGLAQVIRRADTGTMTSMSGQACLAGTLGYMSPEQLGGGEITP